MAEHTYTVFIRVPIPRGDFVDPLPVDWDSGKDAALWKILSGAAQREIDWNQVADRFNVPIDFLLQQVAYLNEQHASQVRRQVRMATAAAKSSAAPSPIPGSDSAAANPRTPSSSSLRRDSPLPRNDGSSPGTPLNSSMRPVISRNASANTTVLRDGGSLSPRPGKAAGGRASDSGARRRLSSLPSTSTTNKSPEPQPEPEPPRSPSPGPAESSSTSTSEDESSPAQSRIIRRPPRFHQQEATQAYGDDDDESEPAFQPYQEAPTKTSAQDLASTLRGDGRSQSRRSHRGHRSAFKEAINRSQTSDSSGGSGAMTQTQPQSRDQRTPGPLSPRRPAEAGHSPSGPAKGAPRDGSDGTPSMGSSFSDLDDASVTQSALEEQMASHMNRGAGSRFSISQALRSRYGPSSNS